MERDQEMAAFIDKMAKSLAKSEETPSRLSRRGFLSKSAKTIAGAAGGLGLAKIQSQNASAANNYLWYAQADGVRCRTAPNTSASIYTTYSCNTAIWFDYYVVGEAVNACGESSNRWWRTGGGSCYVSDTLIRTWSGTGCNC